MQLTDTVALITGGKRIGAVVAQELASRGVDVAFSYARSKAEAEQAADAVRALKRRAGAFQADLSQPAAPAALVDAGAADDLTQETFLRAFKALPGFEGRSSARTWLLGIARRTCADHLRAVIRRRRLDARMAAQAGTELPAPDPAHRLSAADLLGRLGEERRAAFVLTQVLGLSYAEAAEVEDVPVGTIRSRVARAREELVTAVAQARAV